MNERDDLLGPRHSTTSDKKSKKKGTDQELEQSNFTSHFKNQKGKKRAHTHTLINFHEKHA